MDNMIDPPVQTGKYSDKEEPVHMTLDRADVERAACERIISKYHEKWVTEKFFLDGMIRDAIRDKTPLPNNHWQAEHKARMQYLGAVEICAGIVESRS